MNAEIIQLPRYTDPRGNLSVVESFKNIPFDIKRVYFTYDVPAGESRADHAHKELTEVIIAVSGSFTVRLDDGKEIQQYLLNKPYEALMIRPGIWRQLFDFSSGAVCLVLCSDFFDEEDYIRDFTYFRKFCIARNYWDDTVSRS